MVAVSLMAQNSQARQGTGGSELGVTRLERTVEL